MTRAVMTCLILAATLSGCGRDTDARSPRLPLNAQLDSGNIRFAAGDHAGALAHYRAATDDSASRAAAWFGVHMASRALGDTATAAEALRHVKTLVPEAAWDQHPLESVPPSPHAGPGAAPNPHKP